MNSDQLQSIIRTFLKILSGLLIAHGLTGTASVLNTPDVLGALTLIASLIWSHYVHADDSTTAPPASTGGSSIGGKLPVIFTLGLSALLLGAGCSTTAQRVTFQAVGTSSVSVETALKAYDVFAAAGKTTPTQNAAVKAAYEKYQAAFAVVCDAGAVYSAASTTNAPAASLALQTAVQNSAQTITDLVNLVQSFGLKL